METRTHTEGTRSKRKAGDELTTVRGIVIAVEWDENGNVLAASISSAGEKDYLIEHNAKGKELLRLVREKIEVRGIVQRGIKGQNRITVRSYRLQREGDWQGAEEL